MIKYWDLAEALVPVYYVGACSLRFRKDLVVVRHWITKLSAIGSKEWDRMTKTLAKKGKSGC
jgi:hypothetical protein